MVYGNPETTTGGNALKFYASVRLDIRKIGTVKNGEQIVGTRARVTEIERTIGGPSRTLNTVRRLRKLHPTHEYSLVIGSDLVDEVPTWYRAEQLQAAVPFIIIGRRAAKGAADYSPITMPEVSSTEVRSLLRAGKSAEGLVPRAVLDYIYRHGLYREPA